MLTLLSGSFVYLGAFFLMYAGLFVELHAYMFNLEFDLCSEHICIDFRKFCLLLVPDWNGSAISNDLVMYTCHIISL
jgi:hypothetical protein